MYDQDDKTLASIFKILDRHSVSRETFCTAPWSNLDFDQSGEIHSCYEGKTKLGNWKTNSVQTEFNTQEYRDLRKWHMEGNKKNTWKNCSTCYVHERHNVKSHRHRNLIDMFDKLGSQGFEDYVKKLKTLNYNCGIDHVFKLEMRGSNYCNLRCMHCDHVSSTSWLNFYTQQENIDAAREVGVKIHPDVDANNINDYFKSYRYTESVDMDSINQVMDACTFISFSGGEPLIDPQHIKFLQHLTAGKQKVNKIIEVHTSLNVKNIERYFEYWKKINCIEMMCSLDGPPSTYEYFRRNGNWELVKKNIDLITNTFEPNQFFLNCHITFNFFAALRWREIFEVWTKNNWRLNSNLVIEGPASAKYLPNDLKLKAINAIRQSIEDVEQLSSSDYRHKNDWKFHATECLTFLRNSKTYGDELWYETKDWCKLHDKTSKIQTLDFYPELEMYYNSSNEE